MNSDEYDPLWDLLGKAKQPTVSPFFARNVARAVRSMETERPGIFAWLRNSWRVAVPVAAAALVVMVSAIGLQHHSKPQPNPVSIQIVNNPDYDVINHLDELVDSEENAIWLENSVD